MPTVHERELFTDPPLHTRAHNVKGTVMVGRVADFSESTASKIHKRGNVDTLLADDYGDYHPPSGRSRNIVLKNILGLRRAPLLLLAPLARNTIVLLYDLRRGLGKLPTYFFFLLSLSLSFVLSFFLVFRVISSFYCRRTTTRHSVNFDRFPYRSGLINKRDF